MAFIWTSLSVILIFICRRSNTFITQFGIGTLLILLFCSIFRILLPIEFSFTKVIRSNNVYTKIYDALNYSLFTIGNTSVSPISLFFCVWILIAIALFIRLIVVNIQFRKKISTYKLSESILANKILMGIDRNHNLKLIVSKSFSSPMIVGLINPIICLPDIAYTEQELYYVLLHEYTHYKNNDIWIKLLTELTCILFWWNPFIYLLKKDLSRTLEIKCDLSITRNLTDDKKESYLSTILKTLAYIEVTQEHSPTIVSSELADSNNKAAIKQRFNIVFDYKDNKTYNIFINLFGILIIVISLIASYTIVFQPFYEAPPEDLVSLDSIYSISESSDYIVKKRNGLYELYTSAGEIISIEEDHAFIMESQGVPIIEED